MKRQVSIIAKILVVALFSGCSDSDISPPTAGGSYRGQHVHTLRMGENDNAEVIKVVPGLGMAILVSSKGRQVTLLRVADGQLEIVREIALFENDPSESELTHLDISNDGAWAVLTRTTIETDGSGQQTDCGGELVFIDATDTERFGQILGQLPVGPMPDSVDISDDGTLVVSANERDGPDAWGKCEVDGEVPSISVVELLDGPSSARELIRIQMFDSTTGPREPESVMFSSDGDLVAATLQDSHELVLFRVSEVRLLAEATSDDVTIVALPPNLLGALPWPDGVARFMDGDGVEHFAIAGEWNDSFLILDTEGTVMANIDVSPSDIPSGLPRVVDEGAPLFSPDSVTAFTYEGPSYLAFTLRHSGAVAIYDVSNVTSIAFSTAIAVGDDEGGTADEEGSTIRPEGISASSDGSTIVVANEGESSVSVIIPVE